MRFGIICSLLLLGFCFDVAHFLHAKHQLSLQHARLERELQMVSQQQSVVHQELITDKNSLFNSLYDVAALSGLQVSAASVLASDMEGARMQLHFSGTYWDVMHYLDRLLRGRLVCRVEQCMVESVSLGQVRVMLRLHVSGFYDEPTLLRNNFFVRSDPFASSMDAVARFAVPIVQMRFGGLIQSVDQVAGVIALPGREAFLVRVGEWVGRERGEVVFVRDGVIGVKVNKEVMQIQK